MPFSNPRLQRLAHRAAGSFEACPRRALVRSTEALRNSRSGIIRNHTGRHRGLPRGGMSKELKLAIKALSDAWRQAERTSREHKRWDIRLRNEGRAAAYGRALRLLKGIRVATTAEPVRKTQDAHGR